MLAGRDVKSSSRMLVLGAEVENDFGSIVICFFFKSIKKRNIIWNLVQYSDNNFKCICGFK